MSILTVKASHDHLRKVASTRDPIKAIAEFVWNALDADATHVSVSFPKNALGGVEYIEVLDNGTGISRQRAEHDFENIGDSWKLGRHRTPAGGRVLHGKEGRGRLRFYSLADIAIWRSTYKDEEGLRSIQIEIHAEQLDKSDVSEPSDANDPSTGTRVALYNLKETFDWALGQQARSEFDAIFASYLLQYPDVTIVYDGVSVDPSATIERSKELPVPPIICPGGRVVKDLALRVIEWRMKTPSRKIYFGGEAGIVLGSQPANINAPNFDFSVYAISPFFEEIADANLLEFDGLSDPDFAAVVGQIRSEVSDYFRERQAEKSSELIEGLIAAGVYPYEGDPKDDVERRERQVFDIATHAVSSYSRDFKNADNSLKKITLGLLREALQHNPESISRILRAVFNLPKNRQDEFSTLLDRTELANIIAASTLIADRVVALKVLKEMVFEPASRASAKERGELDVLIRDHTWLFGEDFHITMPEAGLTKVMHRVADDLRLKRSRGAKATKPNGKTGRIDQFLGRVVPHPNPSHREYLVVELKRPSLVVGRKELDQLEDYVNAIIAQADFISTSTNWTFYLVTSEYDDVVKQRVSQQDWPVGLFMNKPNHKVWVKTWAEIIRDGESRLQFIQEKLKIEVADEEIEQRIAELKSSYVRSAPSGSGHELDTQRLDDRKRLPDLPVNDQGLERADREDNPA